MKIFSKFKGVSDTTLLFAILSSISVSSFKSKLKTHFYNRSAFMAERFLPLSRPSDYAIGACEHLSMVNGFRESDVV